MPNKHLDRMPPKVRKRFEDRKHKKFTGPKREYQDWGRERVLTAVRCPGNCGAALQSLIPSPFNGIKQRRVEGTSTVIQDNIYVLWQTSAYDTVLLEMDDGSNLMASVCKSCKANLTDDELESLFAAHLEGFAIEDEHGMVHPKLTQRFLKDMGKKKVVRRIPGD